MTISMLLTTVNVSGGDKKLHGPYFGNNTAEEVSNYVIKNCIIFILAN